MNSHIHFTDRRSTTIIKAFGIECPCRHQCFEPQLLHDKSGYPKRPRPPKRFRKEGKESYLRIKDRSKPSDRAAFYRQRRPKQNSASDWGRNDWWFAWPYSTQMRYCWKCHHEYLYCAPGYDNHQWVALPPRDGGEDAQCVNCDVVTSDAVFTCGTKTPHEPGRGDRSMCRRCGNRILGSSG